MWNNEVLLCMQLFCVLFFLITHLCKIHLFAGIYLKSTKIKLMIFRSWSGAQCSMSKLFTLNWHELSTWKSTHNSDMNTVHFKTYVVIAGGLSFSARGRTDRRGRGRGVALSKMSYPLLRGDVASWQIIGKLSKSNELLAYVALYLLYFKTITLFYQLKQKKDIEVNDQQSCHSSYYSKNNKSQSVWGEGG